MKHKKRIQIINHNPIESCADCPREQTITRKWTDSRPAQFIRHSLWLIAFALIVTILIINMMAEYQAKQTKVVYQTCDNGIQYPKSSPCFEKDYSRFLSKADFETGEMQVAKQCKPNLCKCEEYNHNINKWETKTCVGICYSC